MAPAHPHATGVAVYPALLVVDTQHYKRLYLSARPSVRHDDRVENYKNAQFLGSRCDYLSKTILWLRVTRSSS